MDGIPRLRGTVPRIAVLAALLAFGCGAPPGPPRRVEDRPPAGPLSDGLVVDAAEDAAIEGDCVRGLGFDGTPPQPIERPPLELPPGANPERRPVIVEAVIGPSGRVARLRIVKGPAGPEVERALVRTLAGWRFEPARERETCEPVAIRWNMTPQLAEEPSSTPAPVPPTADPGGG